MVIDLYKKYGKLIFMITMIRKKPNLLLLLSSLLVFSCSKSEERLNVEKATIESRFKEIDSTYKVILPKSIEEGLVSCATYFEGCMSAHVFQIQRLDFIALEYESHKSAELAAKKLGGYAYENWAFDDVSGEPVLEKILVKFKAKKY